MKLEITKQIFSHSGAAILAAIFNACIVTYLFRHILPPTTYMPWAVINITYLFIRAVFIKYTLRKGITEENHKNRLILYAVTLCISGILFGSAGVLFVTPQQPAYNAFIVFLMGGMFAGAMGAYAINRLIFFLYALPVVLPVIIHVFLLGGEINMAMGVFGIAFMTSMISVVNRMNRTMKETFRLAMENKELAEHTKQLNQDLKTVNTTLRDMTYNDSLTNITNRRYIFDVFNNELNRFSISRKENLEQIQPVKDTEKQVYGIFIVDIDHFKAVNDTWGHKSGDAVLIQFARILKELIRKDDVLSRWGGEEFVIILKKTDPEYIRICAEKIIQTISQTKFKIRDSRVINITCSVGYTEFPFFRTLPTALALEETIDIADHALYFAKNNGRNQAVRALYQSEKTILKNSSEAQMLTRDLSSAVQKGQIVLD